MSFVLKADGSVASAYAEQDFGVTESEPWYVQFDFAIPATTITALASQDYSANLVFLGVSGGNDGLLLTGHDTSGGSHPFSSGNTNYLTDNTVANPVDGGFTPDTWHSVKISHVAGVITWNVDATDIFSYADSTVVFDGVQFGAVGADEVPSELYYIRDVKIGTTLGGTDIFADDFSSGNLSAWSSTSGSASVVEDPGFAGGGGGGTAGRVLIAFDDGPLVASPTWTRIDGGDAPFPDGFVSGYDVEVGRQTLISQTDTGTATVYINDHDSGGLFDPRNVSSPYFGLLDGRQILLQLYDPIAAAWEDQFRGLIDDITWGVDGSAVGADGFPINASIQIDCVDMFDYLAGFGLTPGLAGVTPPVGAEDGVYYAEGHVDDRLIEVLTDANIDSAMYGSPSLASGNVRTRAVKYDPDESALQALRDAADAEIPFIANIYCDRHGRFQFRGRYGRFDPDDVAAEVGSTWDFTRWAVGDGAAIIADSNRAQLRTFAFGRNRSELINVAISWPQDLAAADMPGQVYADPTSITDYGKHDAPPMSDLLTADTGLESGSADAKAECLLFATLLVLNQKDPRENVTTLGLKSMQPDGSTRATKTWALLTKADISHIINVAVGYPGGTGLAGASPTDDYYIEGRHLRVRPANADYDYVELDLDVSPAVWSMDTHSVFPPFS